MLRSIPASISCVIEGAGRVLAGRHEGTEMRPALTAHGLEPLELLQGLGVVVDTQVELGIVLVAVDQERRRLLATLVATGRFAGLQGGDQAARQRQVVPLAHGARPSRRDHLGAGQHVAGDRHVLADPMAAPGHTLGTGMGRELRIGAHDMDPAMLATGIGCRQDAHQIGRADTFADQPQPVWPVERVEERLGADCPLCGRDVGHAGAYGKELGGDRDGDAAALLVVEDDRGQVMRGAPSPTAPPRSLACRADWRRPCARDPRASPR